LNDILAGLAGLTTAAGGLGKREGEGGVGALWVGILWILTTDWCAAVKKKLMHLFFELMAYRTTQQ
jgi:hypothetical protein